MHEMKLITPVFLHFTWFIETNVFALFYRLLSNKNETTYCLFTLYFQIFIRIRYFCRKKLVDTMEYAPLT